jgi:hypothetical protein|tara:strand:- start:168 stop:335 length:168 start_codon:yes stop_codon:yes gene_type:complete
MIFGTELTTSKSQVAVAAQLGTEQFESLGTILRNQDKYFCMVKPPESPSFQFLLE